MPNLVTVTYGSTNHYVVDCQKGKLLIDAGWAGTLPQLTHGLKRFGIALSDIKYVMMTHHHPDHAGLTQEVKKASGAKLLIHERQIPSLKELLLFYQRKGGYQPIVVERDDLVVKQQHGREVLRSIGLAGTIVETPGHSDDSISLVLDGGLAFVGDLHFPNQVEASMLETTRDDWKKLLALNVQTVYPSHATPVQVDIEKLLSDIS